MAGSDADPLPPAAWLATLADALETPLLLLETEGRLVHANRAGREWLAAQSAWTLDATAVLRPRDTAKQAAWRRALRRALAEAAPGPAGGPATPPPALPSPPGLPGWQLRVLPPATGAGAAPAAPHLLLLLRPLPEGE